MQATNVKKSPIAILCSDIHLTDKAPKNRKEKGELWFDLMWKHLKVLSNLQEQLKVPVLIAGDIFDHWNSSAELINFAIDNLPADCYAIPGQHDLPYHSSTEMDKCAYGTLAKSQAIINLKPKQMTWVSPKLTVTAFPWNCPLDHLKSEKEKGVIDVALIHRYCWNERNKYIGATNGEHVKAHARKLSGFDVAVFGDNHKHFQTVARKINIWNNGLFIPRRIDEMEVVPVVGILYDDKSIEKRTIEVDAKWETVVKESTKIDESKIKEFIHDIADVQKDSLDFKELVMRIAKIKKITDEEIYNILKEAVNDSV